MRAKTEIRPERPADILAIRAVTAAAFETAPHTSGTEARIVDALREADALVLSLVAVEDGEVVGHVTFSPVAVGAATTGWRGLGPISVRPDRQGRGIGSALVREGLDRLRAAGASGCVLVGDPAYYGRFGFGAVEGLAYQDVPGAYVLALVFSGAPPTGEVAYHPAFDVP